MTDKAISPLRQRLFSPVALRSREGPLTELKRALIPDSGNWS